MSETPTEVFRHVLSNAMKKGVRPLAVKEQGSKVRSLKPVLTTRQVVDELLSTAKGLPAEDEASGLLRMQPGGPVKPQKETSSGTTLKIKLQDPSHVASFFRLQERAPTRGSGAAKLILSKPAAKRGLLGKAVSMAAAPVRLKGFIPKGKTAKTQMPKLILSLNLIHLWTRTAT